MYLQNKYTTWYNNIIATAKSRVLSNKTYTELHHIIPRSLGGNNDPSNLVKLTAREHFVCHLLLPRMLVGIAKRNMTFAIWSMLNRDHSRQRSRHKVNSRLYQRLKIQVAKALSQLHKGKIVSEETKHKISAKAKGRISPNKGKPMSEDQKQKMRDTIAINGRSILPETVEKILESRKGYRHSEETKQKIGAGNKGKTVVISEEQKQKISNSLKGRPNANKGKPAFNRGVPHSTETKEKIRLAALNRSKVVCCYCDKTVSPSMHVRWHGNNCKKR
jgi:hypothetical protein